MLDKSEEINSLDIILTDEINSKARISLRMNDLATPEMDSILSELRPKIESILNPAIDRIIDTFTEEVADKMLPNHFKFEKKIEEEELRVDDWSILRGFVASGVEPRGIKLIDSFYDDYKKVYDAEIDKKKYFSIIKRSPLYICKK